MLNLLADWNVNKNRDDLTDELFDWNSRDSMEGMLSDHHLHQQQHQQHQQQQQQHQQQQQYLRHPLRLFPEGLPSGMDMDAAILSEKARSALGLPSGLNLNALYQHQQHQLPAGSIRNSGPHPAYMSVPPNLAAMYGFGNPAHRHPSGSPVGPVGPAAQFWSQWSTLHGLGLGLNQLGGLLGLGLAPGHMTEGANRRAASTSPEAPPPAGSAPSASPRFSPYSIPRTPASPPHQL